MEWFRLSFSYRIYLVWLLSADIEIDRLVPGLESDDVIFLVIEISRRTQVAIFK